MNCCWFVAVQCKVVRGEFCVGWTWATKPNAPNEFWGWWVCYLICVWLDLASVFILCSHRSGINFLTWAVSLLLTGSDLDLKRHKGSSEESLWVGWLRCDLDKKSFSVLCVISLRTSLSPAEHTAPLSHLLRLFISTQTPWRLTCRTESTFILVPLFHSVHVGIHYREVGESSLSLLLLLPCTLSSIASSLCHCCSQLKSISLEFLFCLSECGYILNGAIMICRQTPSTFSTTAISLSYMYMSF